VTLLGVTVVSLASYRRCCDRLTAAWPSGSSLVSSGDRHGRREGGRKHSRRPLHDGLELPPSEVNNQVGHADLVLTRLGVKHLIIEVKRPGALAWNERSVGLALTQAHRYADEQKVHSIAVSDGIMLYARDHVPGGHRDRSDGRAVAVTSRVTRCG